jgi:Ca2+-binding RTX toxin-like protein
VISGGDGADSINGGNGINTWYLPFDNRSANPVVQVELAAGWAWDGYGRDSLANIQNITLDDARDSDLLGNAANNVIISSGGRDWIDGREGDDLVFAGSGNDTIVAGLGTDTVYGGDGNDGIIAGGAVGAARGQRFYGGDGFDRLSYSTELADFQLRPQDGWKVGTLHPTDPIRIDATTGTITRYAADGTTILARDRAEGIEMFIGSDSNDTLIGAMPEPGSRLTIHGAHGDDVLFSNGASLSAGGAGNDTIHATLPVGIDRLTTNASFDGGGGYDVLDTRQLEARWFVRLQGVDRNADRGIRCCRSARSGEPRRSQCEPFDQPVSRKHGRHRGTDPRRSRRHGSAGGERAPDRLWRRWQRCAAAQGLERRVILGHALRGCRR